MINLFPDIENGTFWFDLKNNQDIPYPAIAISAGNLYQSPDMKYSLDSAAMSRMNPFDYCSFQYTFSGCGCLEYERHGERFFHELPRETGFLIRPHMKFRFWKKEDCDWRYLYLLFKGEYACRIFDRIIDKNPVLSLPQKSPFLDDVYRLMEKSMFHKLSAYDNIRLSSNLLTYLLERSESDFLDDQDDFQKDMNDYILSHIQTVNVSQLAEHYHYNEKYFSAFFKKKFNRLPKEYILEFRLSYACYLLANSTLKTSAIAENLGFSDASHFSNVFRSKKGVSPQKYRDAIPVQKNL